MLRDELLKPGRYIGIPKTLAASTAINATAKLVWAVIADRLGNNQIAWPGETTIAKDAGIALNSVKRSIDSLLSTGWLSVERRAGKPNRYTLSDGSDPAQIGPGQVGLTTRPKLGSHPAQIEPTTRPKLGSELPNITTPEKQPNGTTESVAAVAAVSTASPASSKAKDVRRSIQPASKERAKRNGKLTDEQKRLICESSQSMTAWYCFGQAAVGRPQQEWALAGRVERTNWAPVSGDFIQPEPNVGTSALAAWAWIKIGNARGAAGMQVGLPMFGKLIGVVRTLSDRMTHEQFVAHVERVTGRWSEIQSALGNWGQSLTLDESILGVSQVVAQSERLASGQRIVQQLRQAAPATASIPADFGEQLLARANRALL